MRKRKAREWELCIDSETNQYVDPRNWIVGDRKRFTFVAVREILPRKRAKKAVPNQTTKRLFVK
jgi:hypothetical protein